jgi:hypothetical protein
MLAAALRTAITLPVTIPTSMTARTAIIPNAPAEMTVFIDSRGRDRSRWRGGRAPLSPAGRSAVTSASSA